jgi:hypothetical protein
VDEGDIDGSSTVTIHLQTHDDSDRAEVDHALDETMVKIQRALSTV